METGLPWDCKSPQDRIDKLEKKQKTLEKAWQAVPNEDLKAGMRLVYSHLRATLERQEHVRPEVIPFVRAGRVTPFVLRWFPQEKDYENIY